MDRRFSLVRGVRNVISRRTSLKNCSGGNVNRLAGGVALLVLLASGCSGSSGTGHPDGGTDGGRDGIVELPDAVTDARPSDADASCDSANRDNGLACSCSAQCKSKFCVEGYCCNSACQGTCETCAQTLSLGTCMKVAAGVKPSDPTAMPHRPESELRSGRNLRR